MSATQTEQFPKTAQPKGDQAAPPPPPSQVPPAAAPPAPGHSRHPHAVTEQDLPKDLHRPSNGVVLLVAIVFAAALVGLFVLGWVPHHRAAELANSDASDVDSGPVAVSVARPQTQAAAKDIVLPCDVHANQQTALYSRATGYLKHWLVDIGGHVQKGQLLAVIDAPDVDAQLAQTKATLEQAKANVVKSQADTEVAQADYNRYLRSQKENPGSVTPQDIDAKRAAYADALGALDVAKATVVQEAAVVQQLTVSQGFEQIHAPFTGVITARTYDVGAFINPANTAAGQELFDIADTTTLRVFVNVPQTYATDIKTGQPAFLSVRNYPQREFTGVVARMTGALDQNTRTLPYELDFPNADGALYAGMYGQARLLVSDPRPSLLIATSALIFNAGGLQVATIRDGKAHFQPISVGRDLGTQIEVVNGLQDDDQVVTNPGERLVEGADVQVTHVQAPPAVAAQKPTTPRAAAN